MFAAIGMALLQSPAVAQKAEQLNPDLDAIWRYAGSWQINIETLDSPYGKASKQASNLHNDCWRSGAYVACRQIVDGDPKILIVFTCGKPDHTCTSYQVPSNGGSASSGTVHLEGDTWTFPWQTSDKSGKTTYFRVVNVWSSPTTIEYRQEYSTDQAHWTKTASGHEVKTSTE